MAAVLGLDDALVELACSEAAGSEVVAPVNFNAPGQVVIAGHTAAVQRAIAACKDRGAKRALPLPVSAPFHTSLMKPAGEQLARDLATIHINTPQVPVVHNVHARTERDPERIRELLVQQIHSPVKWTQSVRFVVEQQMSMILEVGPGKVLAGLCKRIDSRLECLACEDPEEMQKSLAAAAA